MSPILAILAIEFGGELDLSHLAPKWRSLLPTEAEQAELDSVRVEREEGTGSNSYASFVGEGARRLGGAWRCRIQRFQRPQQKFLGGCCWGCVLDVLNGDRNYPMVMTNIAMV